MLFAAMMILSPLAAWGKTDDVFGDLAEKYADVDATYISAAVLGNKHPGRVAKLNNAPFGLKSVVGTGSGMFTYDCNTPGAVKYGMELLDKYLKKNKDIEILVKYSTRDKKYAIYGKPIDASKKGNSDMVKRDMDEREEFFADEDDIYVPEPRYSKIIIVQINGIAPGYFVVIDGAMNIK